MEEGLPGVVLFQQLRAEAEGIKQLDFLPCVPSSPSVGLGVVGRLVTLMKELNSVPGKAALMAPFSLSLPSQTVTSCFCSA